MLTILAQAPIQPPAPVVPPAVVNISNNLPVTSGWTLFLTALGGALTVLLTQLIVHRLTRNREQQSHDRAIERDRVQRLRESYASFAACAFRELSIKQEVSFLDREASLITDNLDMIDGRKGQIDKNATEYAAIGRTLHDANQELREERAKLVMLLGRDRQAIDDLGATYKRLEDTAYREIAGVTESIPIQQISNSRLAAINHVHTVYCVKLRNMRADIEHWLIEQAARLG